MSEFNGQLGRYKVIETNDNSQTLWSEYFDENCHSNAGAYQETLFNYVIPCLPTDIVTDGYHRILEVGFGLGIGLKATIEYQKNKTHYPIHFIGLELDQLLIEWAIKNIKIDGFDLNLLQLSDQCYSYENPRLKIDIYIGDARKTIANKNINNINGIYQDPFSPKKNPTLWTTQWFSELKSKSLETCLLSTYSASVGVRKSMVEAGWHPQSHSGFAHKRERTMATLTGPIDQQLEKKLRASSALALHDEDQ